MACRRPNGALKLHSLIPLEPSSTQFQDLPDEKTGFANRIAIISAGQSFIVSCPGGAAEKAAWLRDLLAAQEAARAATGQSAEAYRSLAVSRPVYEPDGPECSICNQRFGVIKRRHHCRLCGALVCDACSEKRADLRQLNSDGAAWGAEERVCDGCERLANIFHQDFCRRSNLPPSKDSSAARIWSVPVVQQVQEKRGKQLQTRARHRRRQRTLLQQMAEEPVEPEPEPAPGAGREALDASWAVEQVRGLDYHHGSQAGSQGQSGLWSGWLWKRGGGLSTFGRMSWKRRWFVLTNERLAYYETMVSRSRASFLICVSFEHSGLVFAGGLDAGAERQRPRRDGQGRAVPQGLQDRGPGSGEAQAGAQVTGA